ncbi:hypothetical protein Dxin01_02764 [Deinococcus xinjiangensis]|uniref:HK97 gp10 family phage protein n=2 Tax=Deinococcus xinjiangensis TaxID=457454 RepID=A0ABP9VFK5_9DEIO
MPFEANFNLDEEFERLFDEADERLARAAANFLTDVLGQAGSGTHWPGLPNPSSAPGQYPAEQSGKLRESIDAQLIEGVWEFGSFNAPPEAWALEYPSPPNSPITRQSAHGARPWLSKALTDPDLLERLWAALDGVL